jgi:UDP-glucose 4-epimerase
VIHFAALAYVGESVENPMLYWGANVIGSDFIAPDGSAILDYIHVKDLVSVHLRGMYYLLSGGLSEIMIIVSLPD